MKLKRLARPRFLIVYPLIVWLFFATRITEHSMRLGVLLVMLGEGVRLWANGYVGHVKVNRTEPGRGEAKVGRLVTAGPYAFVRHPLYFGSFLIGGGFALAVGHFWVAFVALVAFMLTYRPKMTEEEETLREECGTDYLIYHAAVPQLLPTVKRYPNRQGRWTWRGLAASREWKTTIWVIVLLVALYFWEEAVQEHGPLFRGHPWRWGLLGLALVLMATDGILEVLRRRAGRTVHPTGATSG